MFSYWVGLKRLMKKLEMGNGKSSSNCFEPWVSFEKFVSNKGLQQGRRWENHLYQQIGDIAL